MKLLGRQVKNSAFIWTKYPECYLHCVCAASFVAFLCEAQLCFHKNITSAPLLSSSSKCSGIPLNILLPQPTVLLHLLPTGLLCTAHPSIIVFPWIHSILPTLSGVYEVSFVTHAIISRLLCCSCSVRDIWTSAAYVLFLMSFLIVFLLNYSAPPSPLKFFPGPPEYRLWKPISVLSRCFFLPSHLFSIYGPFGQISWFLTKHSFQSLKNALHS